MCFVHKLHNAHNILLSFVCNLYMLSDILFDISENGTEGTISQQNDYIL